MTTKAQLVKLNVQVEGSLIPWICFHIPKHSMYAVYAYIGVVFGGSMYRHIWQSHGVSGILMAANKVKVPVPPYNLAVAVQEEQSPYSVRGSPRNQYPRISTFNNACSLIV